MSKAIRIPKKLIEVALPLDAVNEASAHEKMPGIGAHPRGLHLWWARRPLASARAVIFGQLVNDPSWQWELENPGLIPPNHLKASWAKSRKRLFRIIEEMVKWENSSNPKVLEAARAEIRRSWLETCEINKDHEQASQLFNKNRMPAFHDPFAGGGAIPLEAQRLGLEAFASDLNPVAVMINKAMIEVPPRFLDHSPVHPSTRNASPLAPVQWKGVDGLAEDVRQYGRLLGEEAAAQIGHLYPRVLVTSEMASGRPDLKPFVGQRLMPIAWMWARTVNSPNPAYRHVSVPLASSFVLCSKAGKEAYIRPHVDGDDYRFEVCLGKPPEDAKLGTKASGRGANFRCLISGVPISAQHIKAEGQAGRHGYRLMAIVASGGKRGRIYLPPTAEVEDVAASAAPNWKPDIPFMQQALGFRVGAYGLTKWSDLFTPRQTCALATLSGLIPAMAERARLDAVAIGVEDGAPLDQGGIGARAYGEAIGLYLSFAVSRLADYNSTLSIWKPSGEQVMHTFTRQALPMTWDFTESNVFAESSICWPNSVKYTADNLTASFAPNAIPGWATQQDAASQSISAGKIITTDPPYYDNIGYADLSDYFYVWLRRALRDTFPSIFATVEVPKASELVATPYRHGGNAEAEQFFLAGMTEAMKRLASQAHPAFPLAIYYAFKQSETVDTEGTGSTGWETFLDAVMEAGLAVVGTWPMRTELSIRLRGADSNALASSIILVCHPRGPEAPTTSRRAFVRELNQILPEALDEMTRGSGSESSPIAPVDLSQAVIGPGMAVFSKYAAVLEADGSRMSVKTALRLINRFLAEDDFDAETQFCLHWLEQHGWGTGSFGDADQLARAKGTAVNSVQQAQVVSASGGLVRLLRYNEYAADWDPTQDERIPVWEVLHHLIRLFRSAGEQRAGDVLKSAQGKAEAARQLAYRLYTLCERAGWAEDARAYNEIITSWSAIESAAATGTGARQAALFDA